MDKKEIFKKIETGFYEGKGNLFTRELCNPQIIRLINSQKLPVIHSLLFGHDEINSLNLIKSGIDVDIKNKYGQVGLHLAAALGFLGIVKLLISNKANINALDNDGETPFIYAVKNKKLDIVKILLKNKANIDTFDENNRDALYWSIVKAQDLNLMQLLIESGANTRRLYFNKLDYQMLIDKIFKS